MMVAHGITSAAMFFIVGVVYERAHHRDLDRFGGLATTMPVYTGFSHGGDVRQPGPARAVRLHRRSDGAAGRVRGGQAGLDPDADGTGGTLPRPIYTLAVISCFGVVLTAGYMLWTIQRVYFGPEKPEYKGFPEVDAREITVLTPLTIMAILLGILPGLIFFVFTDSTVAAVHGRCSGEVSVKTLC